jgi:hypothetical protein
MKLFYLDRAEDKTGVSGTGIVAEGIEFDNGKCAVSWRGKYETVTVYDSLETVEELHGHGGATRVVVIGSIEPEDHAAALEDEDRDDYEAQVRRSGRRQL